MSELLDSIAEPQRLFLAWQSSDLHGDPLNPETTRCGLLLEVAGYRYYAAELEIAAGQVIEVVADRSNKYDPNAVEFRVGGRKFGNVNRLQAQTFRRWLEEAQVDGRVQRINGTPERPRAFVFIRVKLREDRLAA